MIKSTNCFQATQVLGEGFAAAWRGAAESFASALFHALADRLTPAERAAVEAARAANITVGRDDCPSAAHWALVEALCAHAEARARPCSLTILGLARRWSESLPIGSGDRCAELREILFREQSAAGILDFAETLKWHARRAAQVARLWRKLRAYIGYRAWDGARAAGFWQWAAPEDVGGIKVGPALRMCGYQRSRPAKMGRRVARSVRAGVNRHGS